MENRLPFLPTRDLVIFPGVVTPVYVGRDKSVKTLEKIQSSGNDKMLFGMQRDIMKEDPKLPEDVYTTGVIVNVLQTVKMPNKTIKMLVEAESRVLIENPKEEEDGSYSAGYIKLECKNTDSKEVLAVYRKVVDYYEKYAKFLGKSLPEVLVTLKSTKDLNGGFDLIANNLMIDSQDKQKILEVLDLEERGYMILDLLSREIEISEIEKKVEDKVRNKMNDAQKAYYLKEKINAMKEEIQDYTPEDENSDLAEKIEKAKLPADVKKKVEEELKKMSKMPAFSAEASVSRNYIETLLDLPWKKTTKDDLDIEKASKILDRDHYGLKEVKERILDYLAVKQLNPKMKGTIICLVGPPGVGKTSLARSIADSMGRKFTRVSLGGVRDEAEIRGHRRTYVGAMPGRIISSIKKAGSKNPVFLFDEIDKLASDFRGDPASALLEVLDPEQNSTFTDHFLDVPFDLSKVLFLTTANTSSTIPPALLDRMEVIRISGYTEEEKLEIAKRYLLPKQIKEHGLTKEKVQISEPAIKEIISSYTREAGVRNLERNIANVCRKAAKQIVEFDKKTIRINIGNITNYLGAKKFRHDTMGEIDQVGVATGLAWTAVGGETLSVEVTTMKGTGKTQLTGKLGDVMKESAMAGISYVRANADQLKISPDFYKEMDIHIHVPEGAIPKDGPSAGITIATAVVSALTESPIRRDLAMTGEITLRGRVLP
ncbi:endopeptidase La, partial [Fusobacterium sp.]|uniref:endopeptidase La n=1 Tax=Fusobacterium sp. TaxID=68766 RepID=UPI00260A50DC